MKILSSYNKSDIFKAWLQALKKQTVWVAIFVLMTQKLMDCLIYGYQVVFCDFFFYSPEEFCYAKCSLVSLFDSQIYILGFKVCGSTNHM